MSFQHRPTRSLNFLPLFLIVLLLFVAGCQPRNTETIEGIVVGGSMYPTLKGQRKRVTCQGCQFPFESDPTPPKSGRLACPNCGSPENRMEDAENLPAQSIEIHRIAHPPKRWDLVCFPNRENGKLVVKRIVGLPGELFTFDNGNLVANGQILAGVNLPVIPVFDSRFVNPKAPPRFHQPVVGGASWRPDAHVWELNVPKVRLPSSTNESDAPWEFLHYRHRRCYAHSRDNPWLAYVQDDLGFNQSLSRTLNRVQRLDIECELELGSDTEFIVAFGQFVFRGSPASNDSVCELQYEGPTSPFADPVKSGSPPRTPPSSSFVSGRLQVKKSDVVTIRFSNLGQELECWWNGEKLALQTPIHEAVESTLPGQSDIFSVGGRNGKIKLLRLSIGRGVYWFDPTGSNGSPSPQYQLGNDEYFVIGDNPANSNDSRHFVPFGVKSTELIGTVGLPGDSR